MEALMAGTSSRTARVSGATRNLTEAAGKLPVRGTRIALGICSVGERAHRLEARCHPDGQMYMRRMYGRKVTRLTLRDLRCGLGASRFERSDDTTAEVSRGHSSWCLDRRRAELVLHVGCKAFDDR